MTNNWVLGIIAWAFTKSVARLLTPGGNSPVPYHYGWRRGWEHVNKRVLEIID